MKNLGCFISSGRPFSEIFLDDFLEDRGRILNSKSFRRLCYKTQVFINYAGDHYRNRLTHSLEVAQTASFIAKIFDVNQALTELIGLAHDIGHPPFGHTGEDALNQKSKKFGGFNHNLHTIKILVSIENNSGLNLCRESIDGILKHNGPISKQNKLYKELKELLKEYNINFSKNGSFESQIASLADDITYFKHDIDDGIRANYVKLEDFRDIKIFNNIYEATDASTVNFNKNIINNFSAFLIKDLIQQTELNIKSHNIKDYSDIISFQEPIVGFSEYVQKDLVKLKNFLMNNVYRNFEVNRINLKTHKIISDLYDYFLQHKNTLPFKNSLENIEDKKLSELIVNYIAGMTDRFAVEEHNRLFNLYSY